MIFILGCHGYILIIQHTVNPKRAAIWIMIILPPGVGEILVPPIVITNAPSVGRK